MKSKKPVWCDEVRKGEIIGAELQVGRVRLAVHRYHGCDPNQWFGTAHGLDLDRVEIGELGTSLDRAKALWLRQVTAYITELGEQFRRLK